MAAIAKFSEVSSTSPSGIMPTTPATAETTACRHSPVEIATDQPPTVWICERMSSTHSGTTRKVMNLRIVLMPLFRSDTVFLYTLACAVRVAAYPCSPTAVTRASAMPETAVDPENI